MLPASLFLFLVDGHSIQDLSVPVFLLVSLSYALRGSLYADSLSWFKQNNKSGKVAASLTNRIFLNSYAIFEGEKKALCGRKRSLTHSASEYGIRKVRPTSETIHSFIHSRKRLNLTHDTNCHDPTKTSKTLGQSATFCERVHTPSERSP